MKEWLAGRLDGLLNPILVKEVQQGFRGRGLIVGAITALGFCLGAYVYTALSGGDSGEDLFRVLSLSMAASIASAAVSVPSSRARASSIATRHASSSTSDQSVSGASPAWKSMNCCGKLP